MGFQILPLNRSSFSLNTPINTNLGQVLFQLRGDIDIPVLGQIADRLQQMTIFRSKIVWITATCLRRHDSKDNLTKTQPKHDSEIGKKITEKFPAILSGSQKWAWVKSVWPLTKARQTIRGNREPPLCFTLFHFCFPKAGHALFWGK